MTLQKGLNHDEMDVLIDYALQQRCIRGVTFQLTQAAGRLNNFDLETDSFSLTRYIDPADLLTNSSNTIGYERDPRLRAHMLRLFSTANTVDTVVPDLNQLLCCLPQVQAPNLSYENLFRVIILQFMDAWNFDVRAIKKFCVHIVSKDLKIIPFETMNSFYRDAQKLARLEELRNERVGL